MQDDNKLEWRTKGTYGLYNIYALTRFRLLAHVDADFAFSLICSSTGVNCWTRSTERLIVRVLSSSGRALHGLSQPGVVFCAMV